MVYLFFGPFLQLSRHTKWLSVSSFREEVRGKEEMDIADLSSFPRGSGNRPSVPISRISSGGEEAIMVPNLSPLPHSRALPRCPTIKIDKASGGSGGTKTEGRLHSAEIDGFLPPIVANLPDD